ncbi:MAG: hypothetical protein JWM97_3082 [Phycisphaerales bacterium]|nr:hypothetical protein [Phycisphaerales bacterium]
MLDVAVADADGAPAHAVALVGQFPTGAQRVDEGLRDAQPLGRLANAEQRFTGRLTYPAKAVVTRRGGRFIALQHHEHLHPQPARPRGHSHTRLARM